MNLIPRWPAVALFFVGCNPSSTLAAETSFEATAKSAEPATDLASLLGAVSQDCEKARREIDKARCRALSGALKQQLQRRTFLSTVDEASVVGVSPYDAAIRGYRLRLVGCLTCDAPIKSADDGDRWVTLKVPNKGAETMPQAVELARPVMAFANAEAAQIWLDTVRPQLRAEFIFGPQAVAWNWKRWNGMAFPMIASRVFNRCTGEVVFSDPPSKGRRAPSAPEGDPDCAKTDAAKPDTTEGNAPSAGSADVISGERLDPNAINRTLAPIRPAFETCDRHFRATGTARLDFTVNLAGGPAARVTVSGSLGGTAVAQCLIEAALQARFPRVSRPSKPAQKFTYPVILDGK